MVVSGTATLRADSVVMWETSGRNIQKASDDPMIIIYYIYIYYNVNCESSDGWINLRWDEHRG